MVKPGWPPGGMDLRVRDHQPDSECASIEHLERLAGLGIVPPGVTRHLRTCARCQARLASIRANNAFLRELSQNQPPEENPRPAGEHSRYTELKPDARPATPDAGGPG